jgi:glucosamine--fructose-6-phosphate aminotransferase (isomerizing)
MCGIIGVVTGVNTNVSPILLEGLKRLEYRGYDSAGIATLSDEGELECRRSKGKLLHLQKEIEQNPISGTIGIGHTRWATHGKPTTNNAHPHSTSKVAVVHNGIIENFRELRARLEAWGKRMSSDTDSEVIPHLVTKHLEDGMEPSEAVAATVAMLSGTFALAILFAGKEQFLMAAKRGSPLAIGYGDGRMYVGSDAIALSPFTSRIAYLKDGDIAYVGKKEVRIWDDNNNQVTRPIQLSVQSRNMMGKGGHRHYMMKEIHEQPEVINAALKQYFNPVTKAVQLPNIPFNLADVTEVTIVACGTSYYSGMICKYWLEKFTGLPVTVDIASEFRYRSAPLKKGGLAIFISQSGETADTLAALHFAKENHQHIMSIVNVAESTMALASDVALPIMAGAEIGVASTKAFTAQLMVLASITLAFTDARGTLPEDERVQIIDALEQLPALVMNILGHDKSISILAQEIINSKNVLFIGRGTSFPVAMEGALKLKELTYIHAEGIAAGELKHGPLALVDELLPVIAIAPSDELFEKTCSNIHEVSARGGKVIVFCDSKGAAVMNDIALFTIILPECHQLLTPILYTIPLQLLAYHVAVAKGNDVDQPRNLAKSVTVE